MIRARVDAFHREVARVALAVADRYGFVLGGGVAWVMNGLVQRPTEDVDLFTTADGAAGAAADGVRAALESAGFRVEEEEMLAGFDLDQREFLVSDGERTVVLSLCRLDRRHRPVMMDVGPVMHIDDLAATKVAALVNRREVRDYIDVAAALRHYSVEELLTLARRQDPALEPEDIVAAGRYLDRLSDRRFAYYGQTAEQIEVIRSALDAWPRS